MSRKLFKKCKSQTPNPTLDTTLQKDELWWEWTNKNRRRLEFMLEQFSYEEKLKTYYQVRFDGEWPKELEPIKPSDWEFMSDINRINCVDVIQNTIEAHIGEKGLKRYYYQILHNYTDQQFDDWWESRKH
jgi:hypothetical protein